MTLSRSASSTAKREDERKRVDLSDGPGLEDFNMETWTTQKMKDDRVRRAFDMDCPLNPRRLPETDKPVSEIIKDYATDQTLWLSDFIGAFEKMMRY